VIAGHEHADRREPEHGKIQLPDGHETTFIHSPAEGGNGGPSVVFAPGLGETAERSFKKPTQELAAAGHDVYALSHTAKGLSDEFLASEKARIKSEWMAAHGTKLPREEIERLFDAIPVTEFRKAYTLICFIEEEIRTGKIKGKVDVIGHSQGGAYGVIAVFLRRDLFNKSIYVNPAGQSGPVGYWRIFSGFHASVLRDAIKTGNWTAVRDAISYLWARHWALYSGKSRAVKEANALTTFDAYPFIQAISVIAPEVIQTTITDTADLIFSQQKIKNAARIAQKKKPKIGIGDREEPTNHGHFGPVVYPEEFAQIFHKILIRSRHIEGAKRAAE
jgi:pimeloyl-ACP methyl ester carboxylesterase